MTRHSCFRFLCCLFLVLLLAGCSAYRFSDLQKTSAELLSNQQAYRGQDNLTVEQMMSYEDIRSGLLAVATDAQTIIAKQQEIQTQVSVTRLAAISAAYAGPAGLPVTQTLSTSGLELCAKLPADKYGAPRDCALLAFAPSIALNEDLWVRQSHLRRANFDEYAGDHTALLAEIESTLKHTNELADKSLKTYSDIQSGEQTYYRDVGENTKAAIKLYVQYFACPALIAETRLYRIVNKHRVEKIRDAASKLHRDMAPVAVRYTQAGFTMEACANLKKAAPR